MEQERVSKETEEKTPVSDAIRKNLEKEAELQKQAEELDRKYLADLDKKKVVPPKPKVSPWLLASGATFIVSGLAAFGPVGFAYIIFGLSSVGVALEGYKWLTRETPEQTAKREKKEKEKLDEKKEKEEIAEKKKAEKEEKERIEREKRVKEKEKKYREKAEAASKLPALSIKKLKALVNNGISPRCVIVKLYDDLRVVIFNTQEGGYSDDVIHCTEECFNFLKSQNDSYLSAILKMWDNISH